MAFADNAAQIIKSIRFSSAFILGHRCFFIYPNTMDGWLALLDTLHTPRTELLRACSVIPEPARIEGD
jgi:hypothetical protein